MTIQRVTLVALLALAGLLARPDLLWAADPVSAEDAAALTGDQRPGSILFFNLYTSDAAAPGAQDTRIALTNTSVQSAAFIRLLFVDGDDGQVATSTICLTATQTASFRASDLRPGRTGFLIAVSINGVNGCPFAFNHLIGGADVTLASGFRGSLQAVAVPALFDGGIAGCGQFPFPPPPEIALPFDGVFGFLSPQPPSGGYAKLPRTLDVPNLPSRADARTLLVVNRIGGNLSGTPGAVGTLDGTLFDDAQNPFPYTLSGAAPQFRSELSNAFPVTGTPFETVVPAGRTGWTRLTHGTSDFAYLGAVLFLRAPPGATPQTSASRLLADQPVAPSATVAGAANLRIARLTSGAVELLGFPIEPPSC